MGRPIVLADHVASGVQFPRAVPALAVLDAGGGCRALRGRGWRGRRGAVVGTTGRGPLRRWRGGVEEERTHVETRKIGVNGLWALPGLKRICLRGNNALNHFIAHPD